MKHFFFIHSHTLFLTSLGVVDYLDLPHKDVIFWYSRNYKSVVPVDIKCVDISVQMENTFYIMLSWSRRNFIFNKKKRDEIVSYFDDLVMDFAGDANFRLYVPHLQHHGFQIMATHPYCEETFFIQEGGRAMYPLQTGKLSWFNKIYNKFVLKNDKRIWKCSNWFPNRYTPYSKPIKAFAFDSKYFGEAPSQIILIKWPRIPIDVDIHTDFLIFLLEGAVELGQVEKKVYIEAVKSLIDEFAESRNYIKFHPAQNTETRQLFLKMFLDKGYIVEELPMDVPFELIVVNFKNLKLYGFGTSLLFYGKTYGHHVVSREKLLLKSKRYKIFCKGLEKL